MKKIFYLVFIFFMGTTAWAQSLTPVLSETWKLPNPTSQPGIQTIDTLSQYIDRASGATIYSSQDGGYVFGTGYIYDTATVAYYPITDETGIHYDAVANASVTELLFWAGKAIINGTAENIAGNIYDAGADSMPLNLLGNASISMNDVLGSNTLSFTSILFSPPVNLSGNPFFVSIAYAGVDDTLGIVSSSGANGDGLGEKRIRQLAGSAFMGGWKRMGELYGFLDLDVFIIPVVDLTTGGINQFELNDAILKPVHPSPAKDYFTIDYRLKNTSSIAYKLFDIHGNTVIEAKKGKLKGGSYSEKIDISQCAAGKYFLTFSANGSPVTQKVMVVK